MTNSTPDLKDMTVEDLDLYLAQCRETIERTEELIDAIEAEKDSRKAARITEIDDEIRLHRESIGLAKQKRAELTDSDLSWRRPRPRRPRSSQGNGTVISQTLKGAGKQFLRGPATTERKEAR